MATVYDELADRIRSLVRREVDHRGPAVMRFKVVSVEPLVVEQVDGELFLEEGDPDVEVDRGLLADRPALGATVRVHADHGGGDGPDWMIVGVLVGGEDDD